jgi:hypothetical protein
MPDITRIFVNLTEVPYLKLLTLKLMLYFDPQSNSQLCSEFSALIDRLYAELSDLKCYPISKFKRYAKYFIITKYSEDKGFDF